MTSSDARPFEQDGSRGQGASDAGGHAGLRAEGGAPGRRDLVADLEEMLEAELLSTHETAAAAEPHPGSGDSAREHDELAAMLEARQTERLLRQRNAGVSSYAQSFDDGGRGSAPVPARRGGARRAAGVAVMVGVSAAAALFIVTLGETPAPSRAVDTPVAGPAAENEAAPAEATGQDRIEAAASGTRVAAPSNPGMPAFGDRAGEDGDTSRDVRVVGAEDGPDAASGGQDTLGRSAASFPRQTDEAGAGTAFAPPAPSPAPQFDAFNDDPAGAPDAGGAAMLDAGAAESPGRTTSAVNLRAEPENDAPVITVVPEGREVQVVSCDLWCEVSYDGQAGYIFGQYVSQ